MAGNSHPFRLLSLRRRLLSGVSWALSGKILSASATLIGNALLARLLAPEQLGSYFLAFSVVSFLSIFCIWGLNRGLVKLIASELAQARQVLVRSSVIYAFTLIILTSTFAATILVSPAGNWLFGSLLDSPLLVPLTTLLAVWLIARTLQNLVSESFRGFHDIRLATIFGGLITATLSTAFYFVLWVHQGRASLGQAIVLTVVAATASALLGVFLLQKRLRTLDRGRTSSLSEILSFGFPLMLTSVFLFGVRELHLWLLAAFQPEAEVALYGSALRLITLLVMPLTVINSVIPPMVADLYSREDKVGLQNLLQKTATLISLPALLGLGAIMMFGGEILGWIYGDIYTAAFTAFLILAAGQFLNVLTGSPAVLLTMSGHERVVMISALGAGSIGVLVSLFAVQHYGAAGAALGYSTGIALVNIMMGLYAYKQLSIRTHGSTRLVAVLFRELLGKPGFR